MTSFVQKSIKIFEHFKRLLLDKILEIFQKNINQFLKDL